MKYQKRADRLAYTCVSGAGDETLIVDTRSTNMGYRAETPQSSHQPQEPRKEFSASAIYNVGIGTLDGYADKPVSSK